MDATSGSRCSARSTGSFRCSARTAAGRRSTKTTTAWCSSTFRSPITTPCSIRATVDITGRILEMLATYGYDKNHPAVKKAIQFIRERAGAGRQLVRALGRELHLRHDAGVARAGSDRHGSSRAVVQQAAEWLRMVQNADGGWGETVGSYDDPNLRGQGDSTPSQTAWAIMGLLAAATRAATAWRAALRICCARRKKMDRGMSRSLREPDSRACFI